MSHNHVAEPIEIAGIRNFGWVAPGVLARGEQPPLEADTFRTLHSLGLRSVVSLRPDREPPPTNSRRGWPEYVMDDERRVAEQAGLRFRNVPLMDFSAPRPNELADALAVIDEEAESSPGVFAHCRAGAGRAALVTGAWIVTRGQTGDDAAAVYARFLEHLDARLSYTTEEWQAYVRRVGRPHVWWALREIVAALGSPVTHEYALPEPLRAPEADDWEQTYWDALRPWRERRGALAQ
jgi:protein tyrosine phosphatase (PTP) superfamily phosphohydrolase (DUF442 family)